MIKKAAVLSADSREVVRRLSDDVFAIAQATLHFGISDRGYERLIDAGFALRNLAGLPPPWEDQKGCADLLTNTNLHLGPASSCH